MNDLYSRVQTATQFIKTQTENLPTVGIILGTGLGNLSARVTIDAQIPYKDIPHFPKSTVESHKGNLVLGELGNKNVVLMEGRFHYYEGHSLLAVTFPVRVMKELGVTTLIITNAAGGMNATYEKGDIVAITDHINLSGLNPLIGSHDDRFGDRFPDMCVPYSERLLLLAKTTAKEQAFSLKEGVYVWVTGPSLETKAEYRFMHMIGADVVGMSTVPEVIVGVQSGLNILALSCITDLCIPEALQPVNIEEIIKTAEAAGPKFDRLLVSVIEKL